MTNDYFLALAKVQEIDCIVAIDARGFIWGSVLAARLALPLFLARKKGKLPGEIVECEYQTEYSSAALTLRKDGAITGKVMIIDDILATGGTLEAAGKLLTEHFHIPAAQQYYAVLIALDFLPGKEKLEAQGYTVFSLLEYS